MNYHQRLVGQPTAIDQHPYVCWTRMQAEAGQGLKKIIRRKELERQAGGGLFFWGVGNAPSTLARPLSLTSTFIPVIFSVMKSAPKKTDVNPSGIVVWNGYLDNHGIERPLPAHALVVSRRDSNTGPKKTHYALMCWSEAPLQLMNNVPFDHHRYRNAGHAGGPIGASQVTALIEPLREQRETAPEYRANMVAQLTGSYWVKLTRPEPIDQASVDFEADDAASFRCAVNRCRTNDRMPLPQVCSLL